MAVNDWMWKDQPVHFVKNHGVRAFGGRAADSYEIIITNPDGSEEMKYVPAYETKSITQYKKEQDIANQANRIEELEAALAELEAINERQAQTIAMLKQAPSLFHDILLSSSELVTRFKGELTGRGTFAKFNEEADEFKQAAHECYQARLNDDPEYGSSKWYLTETAQAAARELVDVIVTAGGIASWAGLTWEDITAAVSHVLKKNADKTTETHVWHEETKTVMRKDKLEAQS